MGYYLGVDIGTTYTAAAVWRDGRGDVASLGNRAPSIPSVVLLRDDGAVLVGESAVRRAATEPGRVAREFKRRVGDPTPIIVGGTPYSADSLMARLLRAVVDQVVQAEGGPPDGIAVTHPANWGPYKLDLLRQAVRLADLDDVTTVSEPEAAAIHYASQSRVEPGSVIAVYDLGGGTFDAAVLRKTDDGWSVLGAPEGIERLGGVDFDAAVHHHVAAAVGTALDDLAPDDPAAVAAAARLRQECIDAKEALSSDSDVSIPVLLPGLQTEVRLTRAEYEQMVRPALADTITALTRALRSARVEPAEVTTVLLVGGSSRTPLVAELVSTALGRPVAVDAHPKYGVALGAALTAAQRAGGATETSTRSGGEAASPGTAAGAAAAAAAAAPAIAAPGAPLTPAAPADAHLPAAASGAVGGGAGGAARDRDLGDGPGVSGAAAAATSGAGTGAPTGAPAAPRPGDHLGSAGTPARRSGGLDAVPDLGAAGTPPPIRQGTAPVGAAPAGGATPTGGAPGGGDRGEVAGPTRDTRSVRVPYGGPDHGGAGGRAASRLGAGRPTATGRDGGTPASGATGDDPPPVRRAGGGAGRGPRRGVLAAAAALVAVIVAIGAAVALSGGDDGAGGDDGGTASAAAEGSETPTTAPDEGASAAGATGSAGSDTPQGPFVEIHDVTLEDGRYRVDYEVFNYVPLVDGGEDSLHIHFFLDTTARDDAGTNGDPPGAWNLTDEPSSFLTELTPADAAGATQMCAAVADVHHGVFQRGGDDTGNCVGLPA